MSVRTGEVRMSTSTGLHRCTAVSSEGYVVWPRFGQRFLVISAGLRPWDRGSVGDMHTWSILVDGEGACFWRTDEGVERDSTVLSAPSLRGDT